MAENNYRWYGWVQKEMVDNTVAYNIQVDVMHSKTALTERTPAFDNVPLPSINKPSASSNHPKLPSHGKLEQAVTACSILYHQDKENIKQMPPQSMHQHRQQPSTKPASCQPELMVGHGELMVGQGELMVGQGEVVSIIFESDITHQPFSNACQTEYSQLLVPQHASYIDRFKIHADKVDLQIEAGLTNIEQAIEEIRRKKQLKCTIKSHKNRSIARQQAQQSMVGQTKQSSPKDIVADSYVQLHCKNGQQCFPQQFVVWIGRVSRQIEKDIAFTNKISHYSKHKQIAQISQQCIKLINDNTTEVQLDQSFLKIQPAEIDPLQHTITTYQQPLSQQQIQQHAADVLKHYRHIQTHYQHKLRHQFSTSTIELLFSQLSNFNSTGRVQGVSVGHLLSYINMRTNRSFRNRGFVKMLKRLRLKHNSVLSMEAFAEFIKP